MKLPRLDAPREFDLRPIVIGLAASVAEAARRAGFIPVARKRPEPSRLRRASLGHGRRNTSGRPIFLPSSSTSWRRVADYATLRTVRGMTCDDAVHLHPWAREAFARAAEAYERGRPAYPAAAVAFLVERLRLTSASTVVDLAAGTGKLARLLVPSGARVVAVEPVTAMRELIPSDGIEVVEGSAEAIPLADGVADAVTVAQAFHWFRGEQALAEIRRVLRPGGALAIVANRRDQRDPLQRAFTETLRRHRSHPSLEAELDVVAALARSGIFAPPELRAFPNVHELDAAALVAQAASESSIALLDSEARASALEEFAVLVPEGRTTLALLYVTEVAATTRR